MLAGAVDARFLRGRRKIPMLLVRKRPQSSGCLCSNRWV